MNILSRIGRFFLDIAETIVIALSFFVIIYLFLFQPHEVRGSSMVPNFHDGEYILTDKISYRINDPKRGDVIIFRAPHNEEYDYIKRIIGLPNDQILVNNDSVYLNGQKLSEEYLPPEFVTRGGAFLANGQTITVPEDQYFVLGDNRSHSSDSREWGFVPFDNIVGKAWIRYWPINALGIIPKIDYGATTP